MWNLYKIGKSLNDIVQIYHKSEEQMEEDKLGIPVTTLYREMQFPFGLMMMNKATQTTLGQDVVWGRKHNDKDYVEKTVLPKLMDLEYLSSLPENTVGAEYYKIVRNLGLEVLYNQRFKDDEVKSRLDVVRTNLSRHVVISHDILHTLFKYNTHALGEGLVQLITGHLLDYKPSKIIGFVVMLSVAKRTGDYRGVWKVYKECQTNLNKCVKDIGYRNPLDFIESDLEEVRKKFNIGKVPIYEAFEKRYHNHLTPYSCRQIEKWDYYNAWQHPLHKDKKENKVKEI